MLWIQSMPRMPYVYLQMSIDWNGLGMPTIMCVHLPIRRLYFKARGVKKDSVPYMVKVELTNIPIKCGIAYTDVDRPLYGPGYVLVLPPYDAKIVCCDIVFCVLAVHFNAWWFF